MADRIPLIVNPSANQIQELPVGDSLTGINTVFTNNVLIGSGTSTGTLSQRLQVSGGAYIDGSVGIGTTRPISSLHVNNGDVRFGGIVQKVSAATTYMSDTAMVVELDVRQAGTYTYTIPTLANIGIVSFKNMPAETGNPGNTTITLITTQNAAGTANVTSATGIGTNITIVGYENGAAVAGISTRAFVGSGVPITLSTTGNDIEFISFVISYNGLTNTTASNYQVYASKTGPFR